MLEENKVEEQRKQKVANIQKGKLQNGRTAAEQRLREE